MMNEAFGIEDYQPVPARVAEIKTHEPEHMVNAWKELTADGSLSKADAAKLDRKMGDVRIFGHNFKDGMDTLEAKFIAARLADPSVNIDPNVRQSYEQRLAARQERMESGEVMSGTFLHGDRIHELTEGHVNVPFEQFIDLMPADRWAVNLSDYRGGEVKITETDSQGRVVRQEERMVTETPFSKIFPKLFEPNDMTKVEVIDYQNDKITVQWEVLDSVNRTTLMDIGSLTFMRDGDGTKIQLESEHVIDAFPGALDTIEHILSKRPRGSKRVVEKHGSWLGGFFGGEPRKRPLDVHLG